MKIEDFVVEFDGVNYISPCFSVVLYSDVLINKNSDDLSALIEPYNLFINEFKEHLQWCIYSFNQSKSVKAKEKHFSVYSEWLNNSEVRGNGNFILQFRSGHNLDEWNTPGIFIHYQDNKNSSSPLLITEMAFPVSWTKENNIIEYIKKLTSSYPLSYGYAGWSLLRNAFSVRQSELIENYINAWLLKYKGLTTPMPNSFYLVANQTLPDIGWVTLLGPKYIDELGGMETVINKSKSISQLQSEILGEKIMFVLGDVPILEEHSTMIASYNELGSLLLPLHDSELIYNRTILPGFRKDRIAGKKWVDRFFSGDTYEL